MTTTKTMNYLIATAALLLTSFTASAQARNEVCVQGQMGVECHKVGSSTGAAVANAANAATAQIAAQATSQLITNAIQDHKAHQALVKQETPEQKAAIKACQAAKKKEHHFSRLDTFRYGNFEASCRYELTGVLPQ